MCLRVKTARECTYAWLSVFAYTCLRVWMCAVPWRRLCACVFTAWFTVSQLRAETTGHPERKPQPSKLRFPATYNLTLSQRVTWLDPHIGSERGSPSSILSTIPISALCFTWSYSYRQPHMRHLAVATQQWKNWLGLDTARYWRSNVWSVDI